MKQHVKTDVIVLSPYKFYTETFIKNTVSNIGLNVIDIFYTTDYFKTIDKFLENNYGFSIFIYSNITKTDIYSNKYQTGIYTLHDIYYDYNNLLYNYYGQIINDSNYKKAFKTRFITFNSIITYNVINALNKEFYETFNDESLKQIHELFPDSFLPHVYNIDGIPLVVEPLQPLEVSSIVLENNSMYKENNYASLDEKLAIDNRFNLDISGNTFIIFESKNISTIINNTFYQTYLKKFKSQRFVLLLVVNDNKEYQRLKEDKETSIILKMFEKQLSIVDQKSLTTYMKNFIKHLTSSYYNVELSVPVNDNETINYINRTIIFSSSYRINDLMHYKAIINNEQEEKLLMYID